MTEFQKLEYNRLTGEIQYDRNLQFKVFWHSLAATALLLSIYGSALSFTYLSQYPFVFLAPHLLLIPASAIILNRVKAANRKSGYVIVAYPSSQINKGLIDRNWEYDLCVMRSKDEHGKHISPARPVTLLHMLLTITIVEVACFAGFLVLIIYPNPDSPMIYSIVQLGLGSVYVVFIYSYVVKNRVQSFFFTRYNTSIQGFASRWQEILDVHIDPSTSFLQWTKERWHGSIKDELEGGKYRFFWRRYFNKTNLGTGIWTLEERNVHPHLMVFLIWYLLITIVYFLIHTGRILSLL